MFLAASTGTDLLLRGVFGEGRQVARLVGHTGGGSSVTELVHRRQIRSVIDDGAAMHDLFPKEQSWSALTLHDRER